jgi:flagellar protein FlgJ
MRAKARGDESKALRAVAKQFESIFMKMMLKSMRDATPGNPLFNSESEQFYRQMYDDQLATNLSSSGSLGLADMMVAQLENKHMSSSQHRIAPRAKSGLDIAGNDKVVSAIEKNAHAMYAYRNNAELEKASDKPLHNMSSPQEFIEHIWGYAYHAGKKLNVSPEVLVAQAALETGWGRHAVKDENGISSNNLFNIKADSRWTGPRINQQTTEYVDGVARQENANFRAYESLEASFNDYVNFLQKHERYKKALNYSQDTSKYLQELQSAGYATDPDYATKIEAIMNRSEVKEAFRQLRMQEASVVSGING